MLVYLQYKAKMETRSQTNYEKGALYEANIDFDEASEAWRQNKKHVGQGHFKYITPPKQNTNRCIHITQSGVQCKRASLVNVEYCYQHN